MTREILDTATLAPLELASANPHTSVVIVEDIHLIRTHAFTALWRQYGVATFERLTGATDRDSRPQTRTLKPSTLRECGLAAAATLADCCARLGLRCGWPRCPDCGAPADLFEGRCHDCFKLALYGRAFGMGGAE